VHQAPKYSTPTPAPDTEPRQAIPAEPRYFEDAAGHRSILERVTGQRLQAADDKERERRWPSGAAILFIAGASAACWAGIAGIVWAVAG